MTALLTDFYQLTMAQAYFELGMHDTAVFELFVRRLPAARRFLLAAGLEQALDYIEALSFTAHDLEYLESLRLFSRGFLDHLARFEFSGTVHAMPEGTPCFAEEPILRVTAPILEGQLLESRILNIVHFQTLIASKAARCVIAARGRRLIDFGMRRAHEADAALLAARAAYLAGFDATATVEAARRLGIAPSGTLAHSFIEAHDREEDAFRNFVRVQRGETALLIDTYDTERAARRVARLVRELRARGEKERGVRAVRIDSGELAQQARAVRAILDEEGLSDIAIVLSGGLDEHAIEGLLAARVPVDAFGVGTSLDVSSDVPALDVAYKLQQYAGKPRRKRSPGKETWPGAKQVFRERDAAGFISSDRIALEGEGHLRGEPLLREVLQEGRRSEPAPALEAIRSHCRSQIERLPAALRSLEAGPSPYPVVISEAVLALAAGARSE
jgi:nicotinate phosphoribosyltransferase